MNKKDKTLQEQEFDIQVNNTLEMIKILLINKGKEYRRNANPYHNFEQGAKQSGLSREKVLKGFLLKHLISVDDMIDDLDKGIVPTEEKIQEKFNDILVYFTIQKCMILDRI